MTGTSYFGESVVAFRENAGITRTALLEKINEGGGFMHMTTLRRIESGDQVPKLDDALDIAGALGVDLQQLVQGAGKAGALSRLRLRSHRLTAAVADIVLHYEDWGRQVIKLREAVESARAAGVSEEELDKELDGLTDYGDFESVHSLVAEIAQERLRRPEIAEG